MRISALSSLSSAARTRSPSREKASSWGSSAGASPMICPTARWKLERKKGLGRKALTPAADASSATSSKSQLVRTRRGTCSPAVRRMRRTTSAVSRPGIRQSRRMTWKGSPRSQASWTRDNASSPEAAVVISTSVPLMRVRMSRSTSSSSSAASIRVMPRRSQKPLSCSRCPRTKETSRVKVLPAPGSLSTAMVPPMRSTMFFVMAMPRPVPWISRVSSVTSRAKGSKMVARNASLMPKPLSETVKRRWARLSAFWGRPWTARRTSPPCPVYLTALERRLMSTWLRRSLSPSRYSGRPVPVVTSKRWSLARAWGSIIVCSSSRSSGRLNSAILREVLPLSILLMSKISLMSPSRCWLEEAIFWVYSRTFSGLSASRLRREEKPTMAFIGVRMSWLMLARKLLLASLATLAVCKASPSISYICRSWVRSESMRMNCSRSSREQWRRSSLKKRTSQVFTWSMSRSPVHTPPRGMAARVSSVRPDCPKGVCSPKRRLRTSRRTSSGSSPSTRCRLGLTYPAVKSAGEKRTKMSSVFWVSRSKSCSRERTSRSFSPILRRVLQAARHTAKTPNPSRPQTAAVIQICSQVIIRTYSIRG